MHSQEHMKASGLAWRRRPCFLSPSSPCSTSRLLGSASACFACCFHHMSRTAWRRAPCTQPHFFAPRRWCARSLQLHLYAPPSRVADGVSRLAIAMCSATSPPRHRRLCLPSPCFPAAQQASQPLCFKPPHAFARSARATAHTPHAPPAYIPRRLVCRIEPPQHSAGGGLGHGAAAPPHGEGRLAHALVPLGREGP